MNAAGASTTAGCRPALESGLREIESKPTLDRASPALAALARCAALPSDLRKTAEDAAPLAGEHRTIRLSLALSPPCRPKSAWDRGSTLPAACVPPQVSPALLEDIDAPTAAFAELARRALREAQILDGPGERIIDNLLLGAALEGERRNAR